MKMVSKNPTLEELNEMMKKYGDSLYLGYTQITSLPDNLVVDGRLDLSRTPITSLPDNLVVNGDLNLSGTPITSLPDNLVVNGDLNLSGTPITSLPDNLVVDGDLYLGYTQITSLPDNLVVDGKLDLRGTQIKDKENATKSVCRLRNGDYAENRYIYADGILTHICGKPHKRGQYTYYNGKIKGQNVIFDGTNYAHCKDFKSGVQELQFKSAKDRGAEQYRGMNTDSIVTPQEAITMYRIITGACQVGTQHFVDQQQIKDHYIVQEIIDMTKGQYGHDTFKRFFE